MILAGIILAEAAAIYDGKTPSRPRATDRKRAAEPANPKSSLQPDEIDHPEVLRADVVVALSQEAYRQICLHA